MLIQFENAETIKNNRIRSVSVIDDPDTVNAWVKSSVKVKQIVVRQFFAVQFLKKVVQSTVSSSKKSEILSTSSF